MDKTLKAVCTVQVVEARLCIPSLKMSKEGSVKRTSGRLFHRLVPGGVGVCVYTTVRGQITQTVSTGAERGWMQEASSWYVDEAMCDSYIITSFVLFLRDCRDCQHRSSII